MALDGVPWFVGGGQAEHTAETARTVLYASTSGAQGIVNPPDFKITALGTPGSSVRAAPGAALVRSGAPDGSQQTYSARGPTETLEGVSATGSQGGRTDLVVLAIEDPNVTGTTYQQPGDPTVGPYTRVRVLSGVSAVPEGMSAIPLARLTIPPSTATITNAMITDLRGIALPRASSVMVSAGLTDELLPGPQDNTFRRWPAQYTPEVDVPEWATHVSCSYTLMGAATTSSSVDGALRLSIADVTAGQAIIDLTGSAAGMRTVLLATCSGRITTYLGQRAQVVLEGKLSAGALGVNTGAQALVVVYFSERIV